MNIQRGKIVSGGRLQLSVDPRRELALDDGDTVLMQVVDGEIRVRPLRDAVARVQQRLRHYIPETVSLSNELIADRRAAAATRGAVAITTDRDWARLEIGVEIALARH